jgi:hypothetical protein
MLLATNKLPAALSRVMQTPVDLFDHQTNKKSHFKKIHMTAVFSSHTVKLP